MAKFSNPKVPAENARGPNRKTAAGKSRDTHRKSAYKVAVEKTLDIRRNAASKVAAEKAPDTHRKTAPKVAAEKARHSHRKIAAQFAEFRDTQVPVSMRALAERSVAQTLMSALRTLSNPS